MRPVWTAFRCWKLVKPRVCICHRLSNCNRIRKVVDMDDRGSDIVEYQFTDEFSVTPDVKKVFDRDGCIVLKNFLDKEELALVLKCLEQTEVVSKAFDQASAQSRAARLALWNHPGNDVTGMLCRSEKVVTTCEQLLEDEVYHYHSKLILKDAKTGGSFDWHQDYGYWYNNGLLLPDVMSVFVALDKCVKENGCLQVIKGSNRCGRINHDKISGQTVANPERVDHILKNPEFKLVHVEMEPGDALFFHSNVLHRSDNNDSEMRRWSLLMAYNTKTNNPVIEHFCPCYTPLTKVSNSAIKSCTTLCDFSDKELWDVHDQNGILAKHAKLLNTQVTQTAAEDN